MRTHVEPHGAPPWACWWARDGEDSFQARMEESRRSYLASEVTDRAVIDREEWDLSALLKANSCPKG